MFIKFTQRFSGATGPASATRRVPWYRNTSAAAAVMAALAGLAGLPGPARAQAPAVSGLFATGVDDTGQVLSAGALDPHYLVLGGPPGAMGYVVSILPGSYVPNSAQSAWIWEDPSGPPSYVSRVYRLVIQVQGDPGAVQLVGRWATDDGGHDILVNGVSNHQHVGGFDQFAAFSLTRGFVAGVNTIDFLVENAGGPGAFRVDAISAVPEPASAAVMLLGIALVAWRVSASSRGRRVLSGTARSSGQVEAEVAFSTVGLPTQPWSQR